MDSVSAPRGAHRWLAVGLAACGALLGCVAVRWVGAQPPAIRLVAVRRAAVEYQRARPVPLEAKLEPAGTWAGEAVPLVADDLWRRLSAAVDSKLLDLAVSQLSFATVDGHGARQYLAAWLFEPRDAPRDEVVIHLLSSGPKQPATAFAEASLFASCYDPPRRVLMLPLPVREQRGSPWPMLRDLPLTEFPGLLDQTALDVRRAVDVCRGQGWWIGGLGGYSLGACLASGIAGVERDIFAGTDLLLWGAGGDLARLAQASDHWLVQRFRWPEGMSRARYERLCRSCDPLTYVPLVQAREVRLAAGRGDPVIPYRFAQELADAYRAAGLSVTFVSEAGGHWRGPTLLEALRDALPLPEGWQ